MENNLNILLLSGISLLSGNEWVPQCQHMRDIYVLLSIVIIPLYVFIILLEMLHVFIHFGDSLL